MVKKNNLASILLLIIFNAGCSQLQTMRNSQIDRRTFQVRKVWVRQAPEKDNLLYRKINRMTPLLYVDKDKGEMLIQANGVDGIVGYSRYTGQEFWRLRVPNGVEAGGMLVRDRLFIGADDGQFYSLEANTGRVLWTFPTRSENLAEPLVEDGIVYFVAGNNSVYALDAASGKQLWLYTRQDPNMLSIRGGSRPAMRNGTLYVGFSDGYLVALLAKNGAVKWEKQLNRNKKFRDLDVNPLVEDDFLYVFGYDDHTYCLRAATGDQVWRSDKGGYGGFLLRGDRLYYATSDSEVRALDKSTGRDLWVYKMKSGIATTPVFYRGLVVFGESQGALQFLDSGTGRRIASFDPGRGILSPPATDENKGYVFFISGEANVYALEAAWNFPQAISYLK